MKRIWVLLLILTVGWTSVVAEPEATVVPAARRRCLDRPGATRGAGGTILPASCGKATLISAVPGMDGRRNSPERWRLSFEERVAEIRDADRWDRGLRKLIRRICQTLDVPGSLPGL